MGAQGKEPVSKMCLQKFSLSLNEFYGYCLEYLWGKGGLFYMLHIVKKCISAMRWHRGFLKKMKADNIF